MGGSKFVDAAEHRPGRAGIREGKQIVDRIAIDLSLDQTRSQKRLDLGSENQKIGCLSPEQRFDPQPVAGEEQRAFARIPQRQGKHAVQLVHEISPALLIEMGNQRGVTASADVVRAVEQTLSQYGVVVEFAVEDRLDRALPGVDRLVPLFAVDDCQPRHRQVYVVPEEFALAVGPSMLNRREHPADHLRVGDRSPPEPHDSGESTHSETLTRRTCCQSSVRAER